MSVITPTCGTATAAVLSRATAVVLVAAAAGAACNVAQWLLLHVLHLLTDFHEIIDGFHGGGVVVATCLEKGKVMLLVERVVVGFLEFAWC